MKGEAMAMNSNEHYTLADAILQRLREDKNTERQLPPAEQDRTIAVAQVHALLALCR